MNISVDDLKKFGQLPDLDEGFLEQHIQAAQREAERLGVSEGLCSEERIKEGIMCLAISLLLPAVQTGYLRDAGTYPQAMMDGVGFEPLTPEKIKELAGIWKRRAMLVLSPCRSKKIKMAAL
jgi:hypothetical protein